MADRNLKLLYDETILQENRQPFHYEKKADADLILEAYNPLCGDQFKIFLFVENQQISRAYFHGYGCAVSKASTSVLVRELEGLSLSAAKNRCQIFLDWLKDEESLQQAVPSLWPPFTAVRDFPDRLSCAQLAWEVLAKDLE